VDLLLDNDDDANIVTGVKWSLRRHASFVSQ
jgi:hypothetical protein